MSTNEWGTLTNLKTNEAIRPATREEWAQSLVAYNLDEDAGGAIKVDQYPDTVYVDGGPEDVRQAHQVLADSKRRQRR